MRCADFGNNLDNNLKIPIIQVKFIFTIDAEHRFEGFTIINYPLAVSRHNFLSGRELVK